MIYSTLHCQLSAYRGINNGCCSGLSVWPKSGSNLPKMGKIRNFFRSDFGTFWRCTEIWSEKVPDFSQFGQICLNLGRNRQPWCCWSDSCKLPVIDNLVHLKPYSWQFTLVSYLLAVKHKTLWFKLRSIRFYEVGCLRSIVFCFFVFNLFASCNLWNYFRYD